MNVNERKVINSFILCSLFLFLPYVSCAIFPLSRLHAFFLADRNALYNDAYLRAFQVGKAKNKRVPIMIVGKDRGGKTSLKKHLLGQPFDDQEPSTEGIAVDMLELTEENAEDPWGMDKKKAQFFYKFR